MIDECRRHLFEADADPTISTRGYVSPAMHILLYSQKVVWDTSNNDQYSDSDQSSLAMLLNHGFEFLASEIDLREIVACCIKERWWTLDGVDFLLRLSGSKLPVQNLSWTLENAIHGSRRADESEIMQVLILLMKNGADVTGQGHLVSKIVCNPRTKYKVRHKFGIFNRDLRLRQIWAEALAACGYDAEEFILQSTRFVDFSETDDEGSEDQSETVSDEDEISTTESISQSTRFEECSESDDEGCEDQSETVSDEDDISSTEDQPKPPELNEEAFNDEDASRPDHAYQPPYNSIDLALLEEDARVWQE